MGANLCRAKSCLLITARVFLAICIYFFFFVSRGLGEEKVCLVSECRVFFFFFFSSSRPFPFLGNHAEFLNILRLGFFSVSRAFQCILCTLTVIVGEKQRPLSEKKPQKNLLLFSFFFLYNCRLLPFILFFLFTFFVFVSL